MPRTDELTIAAPDGFSVRDEASANLLVRKIVEARAYAERVQAWAALELRRAEREEQFFMQRFGPQLEAWARQRLADSRGRRKSLKLPAGAVGFRTAPPHLSVTDEARLIRWCKANLPMAIVVKESVMKTTVKQHIQSTGDCPDGAEVVPGGQRFYVK